MDPVSQLQMLCQRHKLPAPDYYFSSSAATGFECALHLPVPDSGHGPCETQQQLFTGHRATKKAAKATAAQAALSALQAMPQFQAPASAEAVPQSLWSTLENALSEHGLCKDPMLRPYVLWAQAYAQPPGALPASALLQAQSVRAWVKQHAPAAAGDAHAMTLALVQQLLQEQQQQHSAWRLQLGGHAAAMADGLPAGTAHVPAGAAAYTQAAAGVPDGTALVAAAAECTTTVAAAAECTTAVAAAAECTTAVAGAAGSSIEVLSADGGWPGLSVRCKALLAPEGCRGHALAHVVECQQPAVVLLPAHSRSPPQELHVSAGGDMLGKLAALLGINTAQLVIWGHVGHKAQYVAPAEQLASSCSEAGRPQPQQGAAAQAVPEQRGPTAAGPGTSAAYQKQCSQAFTAQRQQAAASSSGHEARAAHLVHAAQPVLYSSLCKDNSQQPLNLKASWLAGRPVYGDALVCLCRLSLAQGTAFYEVAKWGSYGLADHWRSATAMFPSLQYSWATAVPLLRRLPLLYRSAKSWVGPAPATLLESYCKHHAWRCSCEWHHSTREGPHGKAALQVVGLRVVAFGTARVVDVQAEHECQQATHNQAALAALHQLERIDAAALLEDCQAWPTQRTQKTSTNTGGSAGVHARLRPQEKASDEHQDAAVGHTDQGTTAWQPAHTSSSEGQDSGTGCSGRRSEEWRSTGQGGLVGGAQGLEVLEPGEPFHTPPAAGLQVKVDAHLTMSPGAAGSAASGCLSQAAPAPSFCADGAAEAVACCTLGRCEGLQFELGCGAVLPALEAAVLSLRINGRARCNVQVVLEGADPLRKLTPHPCTLHVHLLQVKPPASAGHQQHCELDDTAQQPPRAPSAPLFDPPLSMLRYEWVARKLQEHGAETLLDLGCGEARLIGHLLISCTPPSLQRIIGMDCSTDALRRAIVRLERMVSGHKPTLQQLPLQQQQDANCGWQFPEQQEQQEEQIQAQADGDDAWGADLAYKGLSAGDKVPLLQQEVSALTDRCQPDASATFAHLESSSSSIGSGSRLSIRAASQQDMGAYERPAATAAAAAAPNNSLLLPQEQPQAMPLAHDKQLDSAGPAAVALDSIADSCGKDSGQGASSNAASTDHDKTSAVAPLADGVGSPWSAEVTLLRGNFAAPRMCQAAAWHASVDTGTAGTSLLSSDIAPQPHSCRAMSSSNSASHIGSCRARGGSCLAAALVEVVEHLDPGPLALAAPALLGGLQPNVALVTTPNYEYNRVLHAAAAAGPPPNSTSLYVQQHGDAAAEVTAAQAAAAPSQASAGCLMPPQASPGLDSTATASISGNAAYRARVEQAVTAANAAFGSAGCRQRLRDSDHRFEWTREGFRGWARAAAAAFGYDVSFEDIGHALAEAALLGAEAWEGDKDVGAATQAAVFVKQRVPLQLSSPLVAYGPTRLARVADVAVD